MISKNKLSESKDAFKDLVAKRLFQIRQMRGYSLEYVSAKVENLTPQQVHNHEIAASNVLPFYLDSYAEIYDVPVSYFFGKGKNKDFISLNSDDKRNMMISAEVIKTPAEVKHLMYHLAIAVNKLSSHTEKEQKEQVA